MSDARILTTRRQCCLGLMAMLAAGCSTGESRPSLISAQKERELGQEAASEVERTVGLVQDPALVGYVSEIGRRLVAHTSTPDAPYQFHVADDAEPNAFALPGGFVYVTRGLLALANSEDELAGLASGLVLAPYSRDQEREADQIGIQLVDAKLAEGFPVKVPIRQRYAG